MRNKGILYIVGTPIGNLEDITFRSVRILKEVSIIAAEDTRHTKKLLTHYNIHTPLDSYHKFNERRKAEKMLRLLENGKKIAIVSDAGMPGISDSGEMIIREAIKKGIEVNIVPGPTALLSALIVSGLSTGRFIFEGFLPRKRSLKIERLYGMRYEEKTIILYEAGNRIVNTLNSIKDILGDRNIAVAKEMTKRFEEIIRGTCSKIVEILSNREVKGEYTIVIEGSQQKCEVFNISLKDEIELLIKELGVSAKEAIKLAAVKRNMPKREVYNEWLKAKD